MSREIDRVVITLLGACVLGLGLVIALLYRKTKELEVKRDDPLDLAGFNKRQNRFSREIEIEERLGKQ